MPAIYFLSTWLGSGDTEKRSQYTSSEESQGTQMFKQINELSLY